MKSKYVKICFFNFIIDLSVVHYILHCCLFRRGPNKYTRNWEDEDAYSKPQVSALSARGGQRGRRREGTSQAQYGDSEHQEEFPPLINNRQKNSENSSSSADQNPTIHGAAYNNHTVAGGKYNKENRRRNAKSHQDAFSPLESESYHILGYPVSSSGNQESLNRYGRP